jgi:radical SAM protein (TIGR01212 family)
MHYFSLSDYLKNEFGTKVYKIALDAGCTCPNRDGTLGTRGCIFCSEGGSGDFAADRSLSISNQIESARERVRKKTGDGKYIAYFQNYTNTYAPAKYLEPLFTEAIHHPDIAALSIATRPDCLSDEVLELLHRLSLIKPVWVELGLQTIHQKSAVLIRRGFDLSCFEEAVIKLKGIGVTIIVHLILGLPGETKSDMLASIDYLAHMPIDGIKLQLLHVLKNTGLAEMYARGDFEVLTMEQYIDLLAECIERLPAGIVIHRLTGDGPKSLLVAPLWSANKRNVLNTIRREFTARNIRQGRLSPGRCTDWGKNAQNKEECPK